MTQMGCVGLCASFAQNICKILHKQGAENHDRLEKKIDDFISDMGAKVDIINKNILFLVSQKKSED